MKTKVIFRKFSDGNVIAIFPELLGTFDPDTCLSYMHIGQHGSCEDEIMEELELATSEEYHDLYVELESIGYDVAFYFSFTKDMYENRLQTLSDHVDLAEYKEQIMDKKEKKSKPVYVGKEPEEASFSQLAYLWIGFGNLIFWTIVILLIRGCIS